MRILFQDYLHSISNFEIEYGVNAILLQIDLLWSVG